MSEPEQPAPLPSPVPQADRLTLLERFDNFAGFRNGIRRLAQENDHWAGIPMPLDGERLIIEPRYPNADIFPTTPEDAMDPVVPVDKLDNLKLRNSWWSDRLRADIYIFEENGKIVSLISRKPHLFDNTLHVLGCSYAWGIEQEAAAVQLLATLIPHHTFKMYLLTGMFLERSPRSGLTYLFRKLRPTVVLDARKNDAARARVLCALCLHPIAYYEGSWAGAMTPTDDVVSHLMLMRGDEPMFWRRANQHGATHPEAGL